MKKIKKKGEIIKNNTSNELNEFKKEGDISNLKDENRKDDKKRKKNKEIINSKK